MPTTIYLVRHGSVVGAETRRFIGHLDVPLSPRGELEAAALARRLASVKLAAAYSSDLSRTRRTAEILTGPHRLEAVAVPALREFAMGRWEGLTAEEIRALDAAAFDAWMADVGRFQFPEGESLGDVAARAWPALEAATPGARCSWSPTADRTASCCAGPSGCPSSAFSPWARTTQPSR